VLITTEHQLMFTAWLSVENVQMQKIMQ